MFERLSVFSGGATLEAARAVCADGDVDPRAVETLLGRLVDKSLVVLRRTPAGARFGLLQTLADYGADRLAERGETAATIRRHVEWARTLAARAAMSRAQAGSVTEVRAVQLEAANLQQAIAWALEEDPLVALELASNLGWHWFTTMQAGLAWEVLTTALDAAPDDAPDALVAQGRAVAGLAGVMAGRPSGPSRCPPPRTRSRSASATPGGSAGTASSGPPSTCSPRSPGRPPSGWPRPAAGSPRSTTSTASPPSTSSRASSRPSWAT